MVSDRERVAHVLRRLSMAVHPDLASAAETPDDAIAAALDLTAPAGTPPTLPPPADEEEATSPARLAGPFEWWFEQMVSGRRLIEERLVWFWTDHFATGMQKVRSPDLMWRQHLTIRKHATGSFADLLHVIAVDGAMLIYLDGVQSTARRLNENFAREVMELHTLGRGHYSQDDVVEGARAFTGWVVKRPFRPRTQLLPGQDFASVFVPGRHDVGVKTFLGVTADLDLHGAIDVLLEQPRVARFVGGKLYRALVGTEPADDALDRIAAAFGRNWSITALVEAIVSEPAFTSDAAVRTLVRTPLEKLTGLAQAVGATTIDAFAASVALRAVSYVPFAPPNAAGYPEGRALLGPHQLVHSFDLANTVSDAIEHAPRDMLARFGLFDVSAATRAALAGLPADQQVVLALGTPEYTVR